MAKKFNIFLTAIVGSIVYEMLFTSKAAASNNTTYSSVPSGSFTSPLATTLITQGFRPETNPKHNGLDLHAPLGTPVYSPGPGIVKHIYTDNTTGGGLSLIILHNNGYGTGYAHLSSTLVREGDRVNQGQQIALSGNSGTKTTAPHLHFVLTDPQGNPIDPRGIVFPSA